MPLGGPPAGNGALGPLYSTMGSPSFMAPQVVWSTGSPGMALGLGATSQARAGLGDGIHPVGWGPPVGPALPLPTLILLSLTFPHLSLRPYPFQASGTLRPDTANVVPLPHAAGFVEVVQKDGALQEEDRLRDGLPRSSARCSGAEATGSRSTLGAEDSGATGNGEHDDSSTSSSSSSSCSSLSSSKHTGSPHRPRKLAKLVARAVARRVGSRKAK